MIYKQYLGIYINESNIQCVSYGKFFPGLLPGKKGLFKSAFPEGINDPSSRSSLKKLLDQIKPSKRKALYICLPRDFFFVRSLQFPDLSIDDIMDSVVNSLEMYSHLPVGEIYYDVVFSKDKDNGITALLYYAQRKKLDIYINQVMESGHYNSLEGIFPFSYGAGPWYLSTKKKSGDKKGLIIQYPDSIELAIYSGTYCINSLLLDTSCGKDDQDRMIHDILNDHGISRDQVDTKSVLILTEENHPDENMADVALAPVFGGMQAVNVDANPPRIKLFKPWRVLFPLAIVLTALMVYITMGLQNEIRTRQKELTRVEQEIVAIEKEIAPILEAKLALEKAAEYKEDVEDFVLSKPQLYTYINDLARTVPENTWFAHLSYRPGIISMQGEGDDVLKVVESLRASDKYKETKLKGAVNRTPEGHDKFMIDLILKDGSEKLKENQNETTPAK